VPDAQEQLVSVLRMIVAECDDPWTAVSKCITVVVYEPLLVQSARHEEVAGSLAPPTPAATKGPAR
jgi:hypothetical protein